MRWLTVLAVAVVLAGCGREAKDTPPLELEELERDTSQLSRGEPLLTGIQPYRDGQGALRVRGRLDFPDETRIQITIYRKETNELLARTQTLVRNGRFDTTPIRGTGGTLPPGVYRFEYYTLFNDVWQPPEVLEATRQGRALRGPGVTRDRIGGATFHLVEERRL
jgi:hypothetical protein